MDAKLSQEEQVLFEKLGSYSFLEFCVKPSLMTKYLLIKNSDFKMINTVEQIYMDHIKSLIIRGPDGLNYEESFKIRKIQSLMKVTMKILDLRNPTAKLLKEQSYDSEIVYKLLQLMEESYSQQTEKAEFYKSVKMAYRIKSVIEINEFTEVSDEQIRQVIDENYIFNNIKNQCFHLSQLELYYLYIQLNFLRQKYDKIKILFGLLNLPMIELNEDIVRQLNLQNDYYISLKKLSIINKIVFKIPFPPQSLPNYDERYYLKYLLKYESQPKQSSKRKNFFDDDEKKKKQSNIFYESGTLQLNQEKISKLSQAQPDFIVNYLTYLLDDYSRFFNQDSYQLFKFNFQHHLPKNADYVFLARIDRLISEGCLDLTKIQNEIQYYQPIELVQPQLIRIYVSNLVERAQYFRIRQEKDDPSKQHLYTYEWVQSRVIMELQKISLVGPHVNDLKFLTDQCLKRKFQTKKDLDIWVVNVQVLMYVLFGQIQFFHNQLQKKQKDSDEYRNTIAIIRPILISIDDVLRKLDKDDALDLFRDFIEGMPVRYYLDVIQAILIKTRDSEQESLLLKNYQFNSTLSFLYQNFSDFQLGLDINLRYFLLKLTFRREKQLLSIQIRQYDRPMDQFEIKYSKLYKKQIPYYFNQSMNFIAIKKTLKYFLGYLTHVQINKKVYLAEQQIIYLLFLNFIGYELNFNDHDFRIAALIVSQFLDEKNSIVQNHIKDILKNESLDITPEESEFFVQADIIGQIAQNFKRNGNEEKLSLMIKRMQDGDSYSFLSESVKLNIKEDQFHKYLNFLRSKIYDLQI